MNSKGKVALSVIIVTMLIAATAIIAVIVAWAARQQEFSSFIEVKYKAVGVTGQASARWKVGNENWQDMKAGGDANGATILTFGEAANESSSLSPTDKNIKLTSQNNYVVFEYKFTNTGSNDYAIDLFYTDDDIKDANISVFCINSDDEISTNFEKNINIPYVDWANTKIIGNGGTKYVYILASVTEINKDAKYSGSFQFNLDGKDYSKDLQIDSTGTITGLKTDNLSVVRIPEEIDGITVKKIAANAFTNNATITELTIPDTVEKIEQGALNSGCGSLKYISIPFVGSSRTATSEPETLFNYIFGGTEYRDYSYVPDSLTNVIITDCTTIGENAFYKCQNLTSIIIPNNVTKIGNYAFSGCSGLTGNLYIPSGVTSLGKSAFAYCAGLKGNIIFPNGVTSINDSTFEGCSGLTGEIIFPSGVTSIGAHVFARCSGLTGNVIIPEGITRLENNVFFECSGLTGLNIPSSVTYMGSGPFQGCSGLTSIKIDSENEYFTSQDKNGKECNIILSTAYGRLCQGCNNSTIPNDGSVKSIDSYAFLDCIGLTGELIIPNGVTTIGSAFMGCSGLTSAFIPESVTNISSGLFVRCSGLTSIKVDSENKYYTSRDNEGNECNIIVTLQDIGESLSSKIYKGSLIQGLKNSIIPDDGSVKTISNGAFSGCKELISITISEGITSINDNAFFNCSSLKSIIISSTVKSINYKAFSGCDSLTEVTIDSKTIYTQATSATSCAYLLENATTVRVLTSLVVTGHAYINNTNFPNVSTESVGDKEYTVYRK